MKKLLSVLIITAYVFTAYSQDQIILKSAEELKGKVTEIKIDRIVYKDDSNLEGPSIELKKEDVFMIIYENGSVFKVSEQAGGVAERAPAVQQEKQEKKVRNPKDYPHILSFFVTGPEVRFSPEIAQFSGRSGTHSVGVGLGVSYEYQSPNSNFSIRLSPTFNQYETRLAVANSWVNAETWSLANSQKASDGLIVDESTNDSYTLRNGTGGVGVIEYSVSPSSQPLQSWGFTLPFSPRWIVKNAQYGQMHIGFELGIGTLFKAKRGQIDDVIDLSDNTYRYSSVSAKGSFIIGGNVLPISMLNIGVETGIGYEYLRQQHTIISDNFFNNSTFTSRNIYQNHLVTFFLRFSIGARLKGKTAAN